MANSRTCDVAHMNHPVYYAGMAIGSSSRAAWDADGPAAGAILGIGNRPGVLDHDRRLLPDLPSA